MVLRIILKSKAYIDIENFSEVNYRNQTGKITISKDDLSSMSIYDNRTYHFYGSQQVVVNGSEIHYLQFWGS